MDTMILRISVRGHCVLSLGLITSTIFPHNEANDPVLYMRKPRAQTELNKLKILKHCYRIMALGTWDAISVADLEAGMSKTRGAIFYFNKNKSELFINMIDELFWPVFRLATSDRERYQNCNVELFFSSYRVSFERVADDLRINYDVDNPYKSMFNIIAQAQKLYPGFGRIIKEEIKSEIDFLTQILNPRNIIHMNISQMYLTAVGRLYINSL